MKKTLLIQSLILAALFIPSPVFAQTADVAKIQNFLNNIIQILVTLAAVLAGLFFVFGGIRYITSTGSPDALDQAKKTLLYSAVGLAVSVGALVISNIVQQVAQNAFGK
jgi:hypothetical protein